METAHPIPAPPDTRCEYCDRPAVETVPSFTTKPSIPICGSDLHADQAIWGEEQ